MLRWRVLPDPTIEANLANYSRYTMQESMTPRLEAPMKGAPAAIKAMMALEAALSASGLDHTLLELMKLRASQINHCAFCVDMHTTELRKRGESEMRLFASHRCTMRESGQRLPGPKP